MPKKQLIINNLSVETKKGSILAYSLIIIATMIAIAATMSVVTVIEKKGASSTDFSAQAYQTADSGVQLAIKKISANPYGDLTTVFGSCSVVNVNGTDYAKIVNITDAGLTDSPYTLSFFKDLAGTDPITACSTTANLIQSIKSAGKYKDTVRAIQVAMGDSNTKLLLHADGTDQSFEDKSRSVPIKTVTANGDATQSAAQFKFSSGKSAYFDGVGDYLSLLDSDDWDFGNKNFTIDFWLKTNSFAETVIMGQSNATGNGEFSVFFGLNRSTYANKISAEISFDGTSWGSRLFSTTSVNDNLWHHIALVRNGNDFKLYIDGVSEPSSTSISSIYNSSTIFSVGQAGAYAAAYYAGYIDELRISKGIARWVSNFTPPTSAY